MTLYTIKEAAAVIRMSEGFIRTAIRRKELTVVRFGRVRGKRIRPEDLDAWIRTKIAVTTSSHEAEMAALTKCERALNQWVTADDK